MIKLHTHIFTKERVLIEVSKNNEKEEFEGCLHNYNIVINNPKKFLQYLEFEIIKDNTKKVYTISREDVRSNINTKNHIGYF